MTSNISNLTKIAELLDRKGKYEFADKLENLIKISQNLMPTLFSDADMPYSQAPRTGHPIIDSVFRNMSDTAAGSGFAGGGMYDMTSPFRSKYGPQGPTLLPTITPKKLAELLKTEAGRKYVAQLQLQGALKAQQSQNLSNQGFISFGKFISQNLGSGVSRERKQEFVNNLLPGFVKGQIANILTRQPVNQWAPKIDEFYAVANSTGEFSSQIKNVINQAKKEAIDNLKYQDVAYYNRLIKDPKFQQFQNKSM